MNANESIREIVRGFLLSFGYQGLYSNGCGCRLEDFMPCEEPNVYECKAGYSNNCGECLDKDDCGDRPILGDVFVGPEKCCQAAIKAKGKDDE